eukprot:scaffold867_cov176-Ochromonas_danica.AAC.16
MTDVTCAVCVARQPSKQAKQHEQLLLDYCPSARLRLHPTSSALASLVDHDAHIVYSTSCLLD